MVSTSDVPRDDKDWTWTLERRCDECGVDASTVTAAQTAGAVQDAARTWSAVLAQGDPTRRPAPTTWSPVEYACHVRDVCRVFTARLQLMLTQDDPPFENWDQNLAAVEADYRQQDAQDVAMQVQTAAGRLADALARVEGDQWHRTGRRGGGAQFTVLTLARYGIHELNHHLHDVGARPPLAG